MIALGQPPLDPRDPRPRIVQQRAQHDQPYQQDETHGPGSFATRCTEELFIV
jgi:hypothetical protein